LTSALEGGEGSALRPGRTLPPRKDPVSIVQETGWALGQVWTGAENLASNGIRSPDRSARRQSKQIVMTDKSLRCFPISVRYDVTHSTRSEGINQL